MIYISLIIDNDISVTFVTENHFLPVFSSFLNSFLLEETQPCSGYHTCHVFCHILSGTAADEGVGICHSVCEYLINLKVSHDLSPLRYFIKPTSQTLIILGLN